MGLEIINKVTSKEFFNQIVSIVASQQVINFACIIEEAVIVCLMFFHEIIPPAILNT